MSLFEFYSRSTRMNIKQMREYWESVFRRCRLSGNVKSDIRRRFRHKKNDQHLSAVFELFLYEFLHHMGCGIRSKTRLSGRPDYKVLCPFGSNFYLEATCRMGDLAVSTEQHRRDKITDAIRTTESDRFRVIVSYRAKCLQDPKTGKFKNRFRKWLSGLDHAKLAEIARKCGNSMSIPEKRFEICGLSVYVRPIPISPPRSSKEHGLILMGPNEGMKRVRTGEYLWKKLKDKEKQVRGSRLPIVVAVNELADHLDNDNILTALFGQLHHTYEMRNSRSICVVQSRGPKGIWVHNGKPINRSISAVMFFNKISFYPIPSGGPIVVLNPFLDKNKFPVNLPYFSYYKPTRDGLELRPLSNVSVSGDRKWLQDWPFKVSSVTQG